MTIDLYIVLLLYHPLLVLVVTFVRFYYLAFSNKVKLDLGTRNIWKEQRVFQVFWGTMMLQQYMYLHF